MTDLRRLLIVTGSLDPDRGGQERSVREYAQAIEALGCEVHVLAADDTQPLPWRAAAARRGGRGARGPGLLLRAERVAAAWPGVVQSMLPVSGAHLYVPRGGLQRAACAGSVASRETCLGRFLARASGRFTRRRRALQRREESLLLAERGPLLVAISALVAEQARRLGLPEGRIRTVPNGVALQRRAVERVDHRAVRSTLGVADDCVLLLMLASNHRLKGVASLARALSGLESGVPCAALIAGGPLRNARAAGRLRFLGARGDVPELLAAADVLVHPTFYDPSSRAVLEALAAGLPVITTRQDGSAARIPPGAGIVLDSARDVEALRQALLRVLDAGFRAGCARAAAEARVDVSMEGHARAMLGVIRGLHPEVDAGIRPDGAGAC